MNQRPIKVGDIVKDWKEQFFRVFQVEHGQNPWNNTPVIIYHVKIVMDRWWRLKNGRKMRRYTNLILIDKEEIEMMRQLKYDEYQRYYNGLKELEKLI